jgi:hypothetical protein
MITRTDPNSPEFKAAQAAYQALMARPLTAADRFHRAGGR